MSGSYTKPEILLTPPRLAKRRIAGFVMPWMLSLNTFRCLLAPPLPKPLPPLPLPDIVNVCYLFFNGDFEQSFEYFLCVFYVFCLFCGGLLHSA